MLHRDPSYCKLKPSETEAERMESPGREEEIDRVEKKGKKRKKNGKEKEEESYQRSCRRVWTAAAGAGGLARAARKSFRCGFGGSSSLDGETPRHPAMLAH